jgi:hypothetical protein
VFLKISQVEPSASRSLSFQARHLNAPIKMHEEQLTLSEVVDEGDL